MGSSHHSDKQPPPTTHKKSGDDDEPPPSPPPATIPPPPSSPSLHSTPPKGLTKGAIPPIPSPSPTERILDPSFPENPASKSSFGSSGKTAFNAGSSARTASPSLLRNTSRVLRRSSSLFYSTSHFTEV